MNERKATTGAPGAALFPILAGLLAGVLLVGCQSYSPSVIAPQGPAAARIADLWWILLAVGSAIFVLVMAILLTALLRRRGDDDTLARPPSSSRMIILGGIVMPLVVLSGVLALTVNTLLALSTPAESEENIVEVVGHQFWWEVRYLGHNIVTANEIHIPAGRPVQVRLTSHDVIHSFWVPELHGKLDMIPGQTNSFWLQADNPGEYKGLCAEFCGVQHAKMNLLVIAQAEDDYATWLTQQQQPARVPAEPLAQRGLEVFLSAGCVECHTVRGTDATGSLGPELTHVASRRTLGAGIMPNNRGNLGGWIADPQQMKPGNLMPSSSLSSEELQALLAYVETLR
jgi:cytochrome c oxidase subunit II